MPLDTNLLTQIHSGRTDFDTNLLTQIHSARTDFDTNLLTQIHSARTDFELSSFALSLIASHNFFVVNNFVYLTTSTYCGLSAVSRVLDPANKSQGVGKSRQECVH